jgi:hypothetical protein
MFIPGMAEWSGIPSVGWQSLHLLRWSILVNPRPCAGSEGLFPFVTHIMHI